MLNKITENNYNYCSNTKNNLLLKSLIIQKIYIIYLMTLNILNKILIRIFENCNIDEKVSKIIYANNNMVILN